MKSNEEVPSIQDTSVGSFVVTRVSRFKPCELCGKVAETRPYGPNGERICFQCGMKDEASTRKSFQKVFDEADMGPSRN